VFLKYVLQCAQPCTVFMCRVTAEEWGVPEISALPRTRREGSLVLGTPRSEAVTQLSSPAK